MMPNSTWLAGQMSVTGPVCRLDLELEFGGSTVLIGVAPGAAAIPTAKFPGLEAGDTALCPDPTYRAHRMNGQCREGWVVVAFIAIAPRAAHTPKFPDQ